MANDIAPAQIAGIVPNVMVGLVQVLVVIFTIPEVAAKYVLFLFVADEEVLPHEPEVVPSPPSVREPAE